jgi:hypothetical protein
VLSLGSFRRPERRLVGHLVGPVGARIREDDNTDPEFLCRNRGPRISLFGVDRMDIETAALLDLYSTGSSLVVNAVPLGWIGEEQKIRGGRDVKTLRVLKSSP